ncbi:hypothetical protein [Bordetella genomosp. 1]|uniref:Uncharacterized protein n=1 Tax=Bordetella genomosp. 1 TaxID=1395607 RepID=A0ABX4EUC3_9BORD|nr:hypothetical protein [Bordetella genomosp. 1]OZI57051.1 hypothetical protein CAL27_22585 [Bordetella genomosp. 1]
MNVFGTVACRPLRKTQSILGNGHQLLDHLGIGLRPFQTLTGDGIDRCMTRSQRSVWLRVMAVRLSIDANRLG